MITEHSIGERHEAVDADESVGYDAVSSVFPVERLPADATAQYRDADRVLDETTRPVWRVSAVSTATGYHLASLPLTVFDVAALPGDVRDTLDGDVPGDALLVAGRRGSENENRSLAEFA